MLLIASDMCGTMTCGYFRCSVIEAGFSVVWSSHVAVLNLSACYSRWPTSTRIVNSSPPFHNSHLVGISTVIPSPSLYFSGHHTLWPQRSDKTNESQRSVNKGRSILFITVSICSAANNIFRQTKVSVTLKNLTFLNLAVSLLTARLDIKKFYMVLAWRWVFCTDLRIDSGLCCKRH